MKKKNPLHKNKLDILDKNHMKDVWEHEGVVFSGNINMVKEQPRADENISPLLGAAVLGLNNTASPTTSTSVYEDIWTDIDAQEMYLNAKPTSYLILGKPGLGAYDLGEALSKKYNCIHLCPRNIITDEITQNSITGKCLDFNLKHNNVCSHLTIFKLLNHKINSPAVQHRGCVISGIPLVTSDENQTHLITSNHSEKALFNVDHILFDLMYNLKRKPKGISSVVAEGEEEAVDEEDENVDEEEELQAPELPKFILKTSKNVLYNARPSMETKQSVLLQQFQQLFNLSIEPDVIIYLTCPDADVITLKYNKFIDYRNDQAVTDQFTTRVVSELRWPRCHTLSDYENPHDIHVFNPKYCCRPPMNFKIKAVRQICNYRQFILPYIEKKIMDYHPKQVIKLDGRVSTFQMMHQIMERLLLMPINPVIIPQPLYMEDPPEDFDEFWTMVEDLNVISSGAFNFRRSASPWFNRCPVELKKRLSIIGKPKYAVMFFKHVYLMSSLENFISFCQNPRPYLKIQYLEPTCRIIITGTKTSGKTTTAECLSWMFDTPVTSFETFRKEEKDKKYQSYVKSIFSEIIGPIEDARNNEWQKTELDRITRLDEWTDTCLETLEAYLPLLKENILFNERKESYEERKQQRLAELAAMDLDDEQDEIKPKLIDTEDEPEQKEEFLITFFDLREKLTFFPDIDSIEACETVISHRKATKYAPPELATVTSKPQHPRLDDADVITAVENYIVDNDLQKEIEPTPEDLMTEMIKSILNIDEGRKRDTNSKECYGKYIIDEFPSDPEYWQYLADAKLLPDYTIAIIENRELEPELLKKYFNIQNSFKPNYCAVLHSAKDPLILSKKQTKQLPDPKTLIVQHIVHDLMHDGLQNYIDLENIEIDPSPEFVTLFTNSIEKFREDWDTIKVLLEDVSKCYIEVEVESKTIIEVIEDVLLKLRQGYFLKSEPIEEEGNEVNEEDQGIQDLLSYNSSQKLCETNIYCPYTYYHYGLLWEGKQEFSLKYDGKIHNFAKESFPELFQKDITKFQSYNQPFKKLPKLKICFTGCMGSGASELSKLIATELGLLYINFHDILNFYYLPRHYKKVGHQYENPFTSETDEEEAVVEFQMDEENPNLLADILSNETEVTRIVNNYYERGQPILSVMMQTIIKKIWFTSPYSGETGFVLDGFPRLPQDVEDMIDCNCIPDLVIDLESTLENTIDVLGSQMLKTWKSQLKEAKALHRIKMEHQRKEWMSFIAKRVVVQLIIEEVLDRATEETEEIAKGLSVESFVFDADPTGSAPVDPSVYKIYNDMMETYPAPIDERVWETVDDQQEIIDNRLETIYETDYENISSLKDLLIENNIKSVTIDGTRKPFDKILRVTLSKLSLLRNRTESFFEQTFIVAIDIAELLLAQGHCFLSKFGRMCPVYLYKHPHTILNPYKISKRRGDIYPVVHRAHVYFISNKEYVIRFRTNPLKYITCDAIENHYTYPLSIGIIGPPKSGKSSLAEKIAKRYNLICISRGTALRSVLENLHWTELSLKIIKLLNAGETIDSDTILTATQTVAIDHRTVTYGFVLDGYPSTAYEAILLARNGLYPSIVFDISTNKSVLLASSQNEVNYDILKYKPPYSYSFIDNRYLKWTERSYKIRKWINNDYQNICILNGNECKWRYVQDAFNYIEELMNKIYYYLANVKKTIVPANAMTISNETFVKKQSSLKNMCPACLRKNVFNNSDGPGGKSGIVQFKDKLYWLCEEHWELVFAYPEYYLTENINIPEVPAVVKTINTNNVYENGICIVTYAENLPNQKLVRGTGEFAAAYKLKTYLFCSKECLQKFLNRPHMYSDITVFKGASWFPRLSLKKLPDIGYLEQTLANILTEACCSVNAVRPKYPGLSYDLSAVIYIALYLKTHNPRLPQTKLSYFQKALKLFEVRSKLILDLGLRMRSMSNPFASYPQCRHGPPVKRVSIVESIGS